MKSIALALLSFILPLSAQKTFVEVPENMVRTDPMRGPAEIPGGPIYYGQDAARVAAFAAAAEKTPGAVLGQNDAAVVSDTPSRRRTPEPRPRRAPQASRVNPLFNVFPH